MDLDKEIKEVEREEARLAERKRDLQDKQERRKAMDCKLEDFFSDSAISPKDLAEALIEKYNIKLSARKPGTRRRRTTITAELRDAVKGAVNSGLSMNAVSKQFEISYAVVVKIMKASYDHLQVRKVS
ncbi:MAG: hypothetical protein COZ46_00250 [Verrucomicrobia bacterium CG_4_10_14_3_um_filter_43_23]|nr:MAG: hypothetical protein AUJ82_04690 [Verrucomicrobia bacterium CG1_02_43_26]PIP59010.1 MAG: hypothetical protein COX01_05520 [Verrucomicrobia bacterium CG22_combo_CG10-13_8_21_14_all_43_17]PIX59107.1 MAG: hypothetical protein COZ46_00250 [Verrucomicrobia bacterium CG_4_10_14_3_um_filter_43_23]PIY61371.1 MAG: hypothetical protein COY94_05860 [Verrucomicrobia bacterium CG_4_10_14_0_8_um_filter_43_34]PJA44153.1 MAG: hypothetical protein CO175_04575 [Verrucomicrobia bacterium CG_4_9_14_3_um_fi